MTKKLEMYKCNTCGNIIEVLFSGIGELVCCGENMELLVPKNTDDMTTEKHKPQIEILENSTNIKITKHPMENEHYIMLLQAESENKNEIYIKYFYPNEEIKMELPEKQNINKAISYCNIHGLYQN